MVRPRLSSKHGIPASLSPQWQHCRFKRRMGLKHTQLCVSQVSPQGGSALSVCVYICLFLSRRCVFAVALGQGRVTQISGGLSFDPAALKHTAPPTLVLSRIPTSVLWLKYHPPPPSSPSLPPSLLLQASAEGGGCCFTSTLSHVLLICSLHPPPLR